MKTAYVCLLAATAGFLFAQDSRSTSTGWIVIPVSEYSVLHGKAFPAASEPTGPPVDATLTRVDYVLRADGDIASGRATLIIDVLKEGWVRVPMPAGLAVREARMNGRAVSLLRGGNTLSVILSQTGRSIVELDVAAPVTSGGGEEKLMLPASAAGTTRAVISLARADVDLKVTGGLLADRSETEGATEWIGFARGNELLTFTWRRRMGSRRARRRHCACAGR